MMKRLGDYIRPVDVRNRDLKVTRLMGINIEKRFMPSVANVVGTDLSNYKVVLKGQFACNLMHVGRDEKIPVALQKDDEPIIVSPAYVVFEVVDTNVLLAEYLMMWFSRSEFDRNAWFYTDGDVRGGMDRDALFDMQIPVPAIEKQRETVAEYNTLATRIETNKKLIATLEQTAQTLYRHTFVDNIDPNNLPEGWRMVPLYESAEFINGTSFAPSEYASTGLPIVKIAEIKNGITAETEYFVGKKEDKYYIKNGEILFSWSGNPETSIDAFFWTRGDAILNQHTFRVVPKDGEYEYIWILLKNFKPEFVRLASGKQTTGLGHVTVADLKMLKTPYKKNTAHALSKQAKGCINMLLAKQQENQTLTQMQALLLSKMGV